MTGMRELTVSMGWLERPPPREIVRDEAPLLVLPLSDGHEHAVIELAHWGYGTVAGSLFGLLPDRVRRSRWAGPGFGLATWLVYELGIAPVLGVQVARRRTVMSRAMLVADHLLYGLVVADQVAPEPAGQAHRYRAAGGPRPVRTDRSARSCGVRGGGSARRRGVRRRRR